MSDLLSSKVFSVEFDFDGWPSTHTNSETILRPYNGSLFALRTSYSKVFPDIEDIFKHEFDKKIDSGRIHKIHYSINLLPYFSQYVESEKDGKKIVNDQINFMRLTTHTEELNIFNQDSLKDFIGFKWEAFALKFHLVGFFFHFLYQLIMIVYVYAIYIECYDSLGFAKHYYIETTNKEGETV